MRPITKTLFTLFLIFCVVQLTIPSLTTTTEDPYSKHSLAFSGDGWLSGWTYRKGHDITGATGAGIDYQVMIITEYEEGTDSSNTVYLGESSQTDFDDVRFTDNDGETLLDYWRESYTESDTATFWVQVQDSLSTDSRIYVYWGNSTVNTTSNGDDTFEIFSDFNRYFDLDTWDRYSATDDYVNATTNSTSSSISTTGKCEGIAYDGTYYYLSTYEYTPSDTSWLYKIDNSFSIVDYVQVNESSLNHAGGIVLYNGYLYVPIAEGVQNPSTPSKLQVYDASDLSFVETLVNSSDYSDDHWGGVFIIEDLDRLYIANWGVAKLYVFEIDGDYVTTINSPPSPNIQDFVYVESDNRVYGSVQGGSSNNISVWRPDPDGNDFSFVGETQTDSGRTYNGLTWFDDYFYSCYQDPPLYIYKLEGSDLEAEIVDYYISNSTTIGPDVMIEARVKMGGNRRFNLGFVQTIPTAGTQVIFHNYDGGCYFYEGNTDYYAFPFVADTWTTLSLGWVDNQSKVYRNRGMEDSTNDTDISGSGLSVNLQLWGSASESIFCKWIFVRNWVYTEPSHSYWLALETGPVDWKEINEVTFYFHVPLDRWGLESLMILLGMIMVPASTMYLIHGAKYDRSTNRLYYGLVVFFIGWALIIGGIMP